MSDRSHEYLQPTPLSWIGEQLREKTKRGERYSIEDAVQSYLLDQLRGIERDKSSYARMWNWGRTSIYRHWDEIKEKAEAQRTFYRSSLEQGHGGTQGGTDVEQTRNTRWNKKEPSEPAKAENRTPAETNVGQDWDSGGTPYISDKQTKDLKEAAAADARTRENEPSEDDSEEDDSPDPLSFLSDSEAVYRPAIEAAMARHAPASLPNLIVGRWNGRRRSALPSDSLNQIYSSLRARHGPDGAFARMVAAIIITGDAARSPNLKFLKTTLENFERYERSQEEGPDEAGGSGHRRGRGSLQNARSGAEGQVPEGVRRRKTRRPKRDGELTIEENLQQSGWSEREIEAILHGGSIFGEGDDRPRDALRQLAAGKAHVEGPAPADDHEVAAGLRPQGKQRASDDAS